MLDDFQEVARYDLSNRLVPSVRTYGCKLALCLLFLCPLLFPAFPPNNSDGYRLDLENRRDYYNKHIMRRGGIGHLFSVVQDFIFLCIFFKARYRLKCRQNLQGKGLLIYEINENISLI